MPTSVHQLKAELFKTLGHPARIRILEVLADGERSVGEIQRDVGLEASHLSQQLGVLRRAGVLTARRQGTSVRYSLASDDVAELMATARRILTQMLAERTGALGEDDAAAQRS